MTRQMHLKHLLDEVRWWCWENGTAGVPQHAGGRRDANGRVFPLGTRVSALRTAYKNGRLSKEEAAEFEALPGWSWDHWDTAWRARFADVFSRHPDKLTAADRAWLGNQRRRWDSLRPEWQRLLASTPGLIEAARQSRVHEFVAAAQQWLAEHPGRTTFSISYADTILVDGELVPLGRRVTYYRRRKLGAEGSRPLSAEEVALIEALPGWSWELTPSHARAAQRRTRRRRATA